MAKPSLMVESADRHPDCPLISVPPHGDLIDRDAARGSIKPWSPEDKRNGCTFDTVKKLMYTMLDCAPAIIPADADEEQREYDAQVEAAKYCEMYEPTYDPETGAM